MALPETKFSRVLQWLSTMNKAYVDPTTSLPTEAGFKYLTECVESRCERTTPWFSYTTFENCLVPSFAPTRTRFSMFPIVDKLSFDFFKTHESQIWSASHLEFEKDAAQFPKLPRRYQEIYVSFLGFFSPGDGLISTQAQRFLMESESAEQYAFLITQLFMEQIHSETYSLAITSVIPDVKDQQVAFRAVDDLPCVQAKAEFIEKWMNCSTASKGMRYLAGAFSEGVFFVGLFALIFFFRRKKVFETFVTANEWISRDETLHRDYNCAMAARYGGFSEEEAHQMAQEAVAIEMNHMAFILQTPIDSEEADKAAGLTLPALFLYIQNLADHVLTKSGVRALYDLPSDAVTLPWMSDLSHAVQKTNFYEGQVTQYRQMSKLDALEKAEKVGAKGEEEVYVKEDVDF